MLSEISSSPPSSENPYASVPDSVSDFVLDHSISSKASHWSYMDTDSESLGTSDTWSTKSGSTESTAKFTEVDNVPVSMDGSESGHSVGTEESYSSVTATEVSYTSGGTAAVHECE